MSVPQVEEEEEDLLTSAGPLQILNLFKTKVTSVSAAFICKTSRSSKKKDPGLFARRIS